MESKINATENRSRTVNAVKAHVSLNVRSVAQSLQFYRKMLGIEPGLLRRDEMQASCCYAVQDKTWVRDPDGNEWEAFVVFEDNLAESNACCGVSDDTCAVPLTRIS